MATELVMGNEAIALGAIRAGVNLAAGYPGTPSTEILENLAKYNPGDIHVEWSVNEKAALEVAAGASYSGARTLVTMKQVGLNVASDPLMSLNYVGIKGGMVLYFIMGIVFSLMLLTLKESLIILPLEIIGYSLKLNISENIYLIIDKKSKMIEIFSTNYLIIL